MKKIISYVLVLGIIATIGSCKKADDTSTCTNGTFTATVGGTSFTGSTYQNTVVRATSNGVKVKRLDIRATAADGKVIILTVTNLEGAATGKCLKLAAYYNDPLDNYTDGTNYEGIIGTFMTNSTTVAGQTMPMPGSSGSITITSCNETQLKVSGSFTFTAGAYTVSGLFTDMCYTFSE